MNVSTTPMSPEAQDVARRWTQAALACGSVDRDRAEAAARAAYRAAGHPEPSRFIWSPSPRAAVEQLRRLLDDGHTSLVGSVRRGNLNRSLASARLPIWKQTSDVDRFRAFGDFHSFFEWEGYYGEQRYDGVEARYDLMERPYRCNPVTEPERTALAPVLSAVRQVYDLVHCPVWATMDRSVTARYSTEPAWFWHDEPGFVDQDDEGHAVVRYCLRHDDRFFEPAWNYYPDWIVLAAIDTYPALLGTAPVPAWEGCREVALAAGPWWPFADVAVMTERPTLLRLNGQGQLHADQEAAVVWPEGSQVRARGGVADEVR